MFNPVENDKFQYFGLWNSYKRLDFGLYTHILKVKEFNKNNNKCIGLFGFGRHLEFQNTVCHHILVYDTPPIS